VGATIVTGHDLEILVPRPPVAVFVLDASVGKVHMVVVVRELVLTRPTSDLFGLPSGSPVAVFAAAIPLLKKLLVVPLELVVENDSPNLTAVLADALLGTLVSAKDVGVVRQLARLLDPGIEGLTGLVAAVVARVAVSFKKIAAAGRQRHRAVV
jgi:hypothetical protein